MWTSGQGIRDTSVSSTTTTTKNGSDSIQPLPQPCSTEMKQSPTASLDMHHGHALYQAIVGASSHEHAPLHTQRLVRTREMNESICGRKVMCNK